MYKKLHKINEFLYFIISILISDDSEDISTIIQNYKGSCLWTEENEQYAIDVLAGAENVLKNNQYYHTKRTLKLVEINGVTKVARIRDNRIMATKNKVLSIIANAHRNAGYKGVKKTYNKVSEIYSNIPTSLIYSYIKQCKCKNCKYRAEKRRLLLYMS